MDLRFVRLLNFLAFWLLLSGGVAYSQVELDVTSQTITESEGGDSTSADFNVLGVPAGTQISVFNVSYTDVQHIGWLNVNVDGTTVHVDANNDASKQLARGRYSAFVTMQIGFIFKVASVYLVVSPQDNQFRFSADGPDNPNAFDLDSQKGLLLSTSASQSSIWIYYNNLDTSTNIPFKATFDPANRTPWLNIQPATGTTPQKLLVSVSPGTLPASSAAYDGFLIISAIGDQSKTGSLPIHFKAEGTPQGQTLLPGTTVPIMFATAGVFAGEAGFRVNVPSDADELTIGASSSQPIQIYARYASDVAPNGGNPVFDFASDTGSNPTIIIKRPSLKPGTWYIAIHTFSAMTGVITVNITSIQPPCTYTLSRSSVHATSDAGFDSMKLTTQVGCSWSATSDVQWLHITSNGQGTDTATISYSWDANPGDARNGHIRVEGEQSELECELDQDAAPAPPLQSVPQVQFSANPTGLNYGASTTLAWSVTGADTISIDPGIGTVASQGNRRVRPGRDTKYILTAHNSAGNASAQVLVTVTGQPPSSRKILTATPNPILVSSAGTPGVTKLSWAAPTGVQKVEVHINAPNGHSMGASSATGSTTTGKWVRDGMTFYLQDVTNNKPLTVENTLDTVTVRVVEANTTLFAASPLYVPPGKQSGKVMLFWNAPGAGKVQIRVKSSTGPPMTGDLSSTSGWMVTPDWVREGMTFFLQEDTGGSSAGDQKNLGKATASFSPSP